MDRQWDLGTNWLKLHKVKALDTPPSFPLDYYVLLILRVSDQCFLTQQSERWTI